MVTGNAEKKGLALGNPTATKPANTATCLSGGGGGNRWVSTELTCERAVVPGVPHFNYLAPRKAKENKLLYVDGVSGRRPRSPPAEVVGPPMSAGKAGFGSHDVSLADEEVHVVPKIREGGEPC